MKTMAFFRKLTSLIFVMLTLVLVGCAHTQKKSDSSVGPARGEIDDSVFHWLVSEKPEDKPSDADLHRFLTRSQRVTYGTHYLDFFATLETLLERPDGKICFSFRVETDDTDARDGLKWDAYIIRAGHSESRVNFESFVAVPSDRYPLVFSGKGCADYAYRPKYPIYLLVTPTFKPNIEMIRLEWDVPAEWYVPKKSE